MKRTPVREVSPAAAIRPVAAPVNTYVRPADPAPSNLHDVARGLSNFSDGLGAFLQKRQADRDDADRIRGEALFHQNNSVGWSEAVKQGIAPANASPIFVESYKRAQGNLAGIRLREQFNAAYLQWEGRNSNDEAQFQEFLGGFIKDSIGTEDPDILSGLLPHIETLTNDGYSVFGRDSANAVYGGSVQTRAAISGDTIDWASQHGLETGDGTNYEHLKEDLLALREDALASGIRVADYDQQLVDTIVDKAIEHGDPMLLDLLDEVWPGYDVKLSSLPEFRDLKGNGLSTLEQRARQRQEDLDEKAQERDDIEKDAAARQIARIISEDPLADIPEELVALWEKHEPLARQKIENLRSTMLKGGERESSEDLIAIERLVQEGATVEDILELAGPGGPIKDAATLRTIIDRTNRRRDALREGTGILKEATAKRFLSTIAERTMSKVWEEEGLFAPEGLTDEGIEATRDFERRLIEWDVNNPNATLEDRYRAINEVGTLILKRIDLGTRQYISKADAERMRRGIEGHSRVPSSVQETQAEVKSQASTPAYDLEPFTHDAPPSLWDLNRPTLERVVREAEAAGLPLDEYIEQFWRLVREMTGSPNEGGPGGQ